MYRITSYNVCYTKLLRKSHQKAQKAIETGIFKDEIHPIMTSNASITQDDGVRFNQTIEALNKLKPIFDKLSGTVTAGNSSQVSDGACSLIVCTESKAKELNLEPLGFIKDYAYAGLDANRMGFRITSYNVCYTKLLRLKKSY